LPAQKIAAYWEQGVEEILGSKITEDVLPKGDLVDYWFGGLHAYFQNLRDASRFLNSFAFMVSGFLQGNTWEVSVMDLIVGRTQEELKKSGGVKIVKIGRFENRSRRGVNTMGRSRRSFQVFETVFHAVACAFDKDDFGVVKNPPVKRAE
jgi:hypothetical protein